jgi:hypothetical protein
MGKNLEALTVHQLDDLVKEAHCFTFRNDNGTAWVGGKEYVAKRDDQIQVRKGARVVIGPQKVTYGLYPGSGDRIGYTEVLVTLDMVGRPVAVFTSIEEKTEGDNLKKNQKNWHNRVLEAGGISEIWSVEKGEIHVEKNPIG